MKINIFVEFPVLWKFTLSWNLPYYGIYHFTKFMVLWKFTFLRNSFQIYYGIAEFKVLENLQFYGIYGFMKISGFIEFPVLRKFTVFRNLPNFRFYIVSNFIKISKINPNYFKILPFYPPKLYPPDNYSWPRANPD